MAGVVRSGRADCDVTFLCGSVRSRIRFGLLVLLVGATVAVAADRAKSGGTSPIVHAGGTLATGRRATATHAPVITGGVSTNVTMSENGAPTPFRLTLEATDADPGDTLTWSVCNTPFHGAASAGGSGASTAVGYRAPPYFTGTDRFVVQVSDSVGNTDRITVDVTVTAVNTAGKTLFIFE